VKFLLFSKIPFEVSHPVALIESYCFQNDFYKNYDFLLVERKREVKDVNKIGARIEKWMEEHSNQILIDYYKNLRESDNLRNLTQISETISGNNLLGLTKVRIFDILWWSYLKAKRLRQEKNINWSTIK